MSKPEHIVPFGTFTLIWLALLALTATTVYVSRLPLGALHVWAALGIAVIKSSLVVLIFMHLKYENWVFKFFLLVALTILAIFIGFTFFDTLYR
jgi:cytochrome c oxidase subunit IV